MAIICILLSAYLDLVMCYFLTCKNLLISLQIVWKLTAWMKDYFKF